MLICFVDRHMILNEGVKGSSLLIGVGCVEGDLDSVEFRGGSP